MLIYTLPNGRQLLFCHLTSVFNTLILADDGRGEAGGEGKEAAAPAEEEEDDDEEEAVSRLEEQRKKQRMGT